MRASLALLVCIAQVGLVAACSLRLWSQGETSHEEVSNRATFVAEFSSARDVRRPHPLLDKTLDIAVGPRPDDPTVTVLQQPHAVFRTVDNRVFVTDTLTRKVHVFDFGNSKYYLLQHPLVEEPSGVAVDKDGNAYVTDSRFATVFVFDRKGKFRRFLKEHRDKESFFDSPEGIAIDETNGRIYVVDSPRHMVIVLDKKGKVLSQFGTRGGGSRPGQFRDPTQVVVAAREIFVLDVGNRRVQVLDKRGNFKRQFNVFADKRSGLAIDEMNRVYVSNDEVDMIQVYAPDGQPVYTLGTVGTKAGEFEGPAGLWMDAGHCLYVADTKNKRVELFDVARTSSCQLH